MTYQPASRYWAFQWIETVIYLALCGSCLWWINRNRSTELDIRPPRTRQQGPGTPKLSVTPHDPVVSVACLHHSSGADLALFPGSSLVMQQPPADGVLGYLPAGPVSRSDLLRLYPWADDTAVMFECAGLALPELVGALSRPYGECGTHAAVARPKTLCVPAYHAPAVKALAGGLTRAASSCGVVEARLPPSREASVMG